MRKENVQMIAQSAPQTYDTNALSSQRCAEFGQRLLAEIQSHGMNDELDKRCAEYVDKAKRTVKAMNERRAPITKLFDEIRSQFTGMENTVDPAKKDTVPYQIQQHRNAYAAKKREEAERARREEMARQQRIQSINRYKQDCEDDYKRQFNNAVTNCINELTELNTTLTLDNYDAQSEKIKQFAIELTNDWFRNLPSYATSLLNLPMATAFRFVKKSSTTFLPSSKSNTSMRSENTAILLLMPCPQRSANWNAWHKPMPRRKRVWKPNSKQRKLPNCAASMRNADARRKKPKQHSR